jgi:hypothetical protein
MLRLEEGEIATAECGARAGECHAARVGVTIQVVPDVEQLAVHGLIDDVARLRTIDRHNPNGVGRYQKFVAHGASFLATAQSCFPRYVSVNSEAAVAVPFPEEVPR